MIYLDHAATTPILPEARAAMASALADWANPSSQHGPGRAARAVLEDARARVARALGWEGEVIFTSGATEALALAWQGAKGTRKWASATEHPAVLRLAGEALVPVDGAGQVDVAALPPADLLAIQQVNNETGVIQPLEALAARGGEALWLADAAQGAGKLPLPPADMVVIAGHKLGGPPGVGALLLRDLAQIMPQGGQERGYRPGTENVPAVVGLAAALEVAHDWLEEAAAHRAWFEGEMAALGFEALGAEAPRVPTVGAYRLPGLSATLALIRTDMAGIAISAGSACSSGSLKPSHVPPAMGLSEAQAREVFRVSIGRETTREHLEALLRVLAPLAKGRRAA